MRVIVTVIVTVSAVPCVVTRGEGRAGPVVDGAGDVYGSVSPGQDAAHLHLPAGAVWVMDDTDARQRRGEPAGCRACSCA